MPVTVEEVVVGAGGSLGTNPTIALATTPLAGDIVVVVLQCSQSTTITNTSGLGATWIKAVGTGIEDGLNNSTCSVMIGRNASTSGTVTLTLSTSRSGSLRAFLIRGIVGDSTPVVSNSNVAASITSATLSASQIVFGFGSTSDTGAISFPSATTPVSGWVTQAIIQSTTVNKNGSAYYIPTGTTDHDVSLTSTISSSERTTILSLGGTTPSRLVTDYVETLTIPTATPVILTTDYIEAATIPTLTPHVLSSVYIEALTPSYTPFRGWGVPL